MKKQVLTLIAAALLLPSAAAVSTDIIDDSVPEEIKLGDSNSFTAEFYCKNGTAKDANITDENGNFIVGSDSDLKDVGDNKTAWNVDIDDYIGKTGQYTLNAYCADENTSEKDSISFSVYDYTFFLRTPSTLNSVTTYPKSSFDLEFNIQKNVEGPEKNLSRNLKASIDLKQDGSLLTLANEKPFEFKQGTAYMNEVDIPSPFPQYGTYDLKLSIFENNGNTKLLGYTAKDAITVRKALSVDMANPKPVQRSAGGTENLHLKIESPLINSGEDFPKLSFTKAVENESAKDVSHTCGTTNKENIYTCEIPVSISDRSPGEYSIKITANYEHNGVTYTDTGSVPLEFTIPFKGNLRFQNGQIVDATIELKKQETGQWYSTQTDSGTGKYRLDLLPGEYTLKLTTPVVREVKLQDVPITGEYRRVTELSPLKIDKFDGSSGIDGIQTVKLFSLEFALPFDQGDIWMQYDDTKVSQAEEDLQLYVCHEWTNRECTGEWEQKGFEINTVTNLIHFNVSQLSSGFVLGNRQELGISTSLPSNTVNIGEQVDFSGTIIDNDGNAVENAEVTYQLEDTNISGTTTTDSRGSFLATGLYAPNQRGAYTLHVEAEKTPYRSVETTETLQVKRSEDFTIIPPDKVVAPLGQQVQTTIEIVNNGQKNLTSLSIATQGISTDWHALSPRTITGLSPGQSQQVDLTVNVPADTCAQECKLYHFATITASTDNKERSSEFTIELDPNASTATGESSSDGLMNLPSGSQVTDSVTGMVSSSATNPVIGVIVFLAALFLVIRHKKQGGNSSSGASSYSYSSSSSPRRRSVSVNVDNNGSEKSVFKQIKDDLKGL